MKGSKSRCESFFGHTFVPDSLRALDLSVDVRKMPFSKKYYRRIWTLGVVWIRVMAVSTTLWDADKKG